MQYSVIEFFGVNTKFNVNLVRRFRVLNNVPKCWEEVTICTTPHGTYESGLTTIYQSKTTKKYYMVRYFDGCFKEMYAEVSGIDWRKAKAEISRFWDTHGNVISEMWDNCRNKEMTHAERNIRTERLRREAKGILIGLMG